MTEKGGDKSGSNGVEQDRVRLISPHKEGGSLKKGREVQYKVD